MSGTYPGFHRNQLELLRKMASSGPAWPPVAARITQQITQHEQAESSPISYFLV
jgi:hypothetical protein